MKTTPKFLLVVACTLAAASAVTAAPRSKKDEAKAEFDKAEISYKLGRFQEALDAYSRAYEMFQAPPLLFNIGQCHRNLHNYDRAIFSFESYLREEVNPSRRKLAEQLIAELRADLAKQRAAMAARPPEVSPTPPPAVEAAPVVKPLAIVEPPPPPVAPAPALIAAPEPTDDRPADRPLTHKWWFWTAIGAGVVAAAAGAFVYYESGGTNQTLPGGTIGTLDRR